MLDEFPVPISGVRARADARPEIGVSPLSRAQRRLWLLAELEPASAANNVPIVLAWRGVPDADVLARALHEIVRRHDALGSLVRLVDGVPMRVRDEAFVPELRRTMLPPETSLAEAIANERAQPFDLKTAAPIRAALLAKDDAHVLIVTVHRIAADRRSTGIFARELSATYGDLLAGRRPTPPPLWSRYDEFVAEQHDAATDQSAIASADYWRRTLATPPARLELPIASTSAIRDDRVGSETCTFDLALSEAVRDLAAREADLFCVLAAAFATLLYRYAGATDVVLGAPIPDRPRIGFDSVIGLFAETYPLRARIAPDRSFIENLAVMRESAVAAQAHRGADFDLLIEELRPPHGEKHEQIASLGFGLDVRESVDGEHFSRMHEEDAIAPFELNLDVRTTGPRLACTIDYRTQLFDARDVRAMLDAYAVLLRSICAAPDLPVARLAIVDDAERRRQLVALNDTDRPYDRCRAHEAFEAHAALRPDDVALVDGATRVTFATLNDRANRLARYLRSRGVERGSRAAVCFERSADSIVALLAVAKTGAGYVPLDPEYPAERLRAMTQAAQARVVVTTDRHAAAFADASLAVVRVDADAAAVRGFAGDDLGIAGDPEDLLCILYTSGSTGTPKGVRLPHRALASTVTGSDIVTIEPGDAIAHASAVTFDVGAFEIWLALMNGGRLVVVPKSSLLEPATLDRTIAAERIDVLCMTPAMFHEVARTAPTTFRALRRLFIGGDVLDVEAVRRVLLAGGPRRLGHMWGPTEATSYSTCRFIDEPPPSGVPLSLGGPMYNNTVYVLDRDRNLLPPGVSGELYVGGPGLALGYLDDETTRRKFVPHPFDDDPSVRLYATGDAGRLGADGELTFLGRIDRQIKLRGFRIEPGEIEAVLRRLPGVVDAVVAPDGKGIEKRLVAYVVPAAADVRPERLIACLRAQLPSYMLPERVVLVEAFPMTATGKIDRKALPTPPRSEPAPEAALPEDGREVERQLAVIWQRLLGVPAVGMHDSFFDLGGHSLLAVRLMGEIEAVFGKRLPLALLFERPTVAHLAAALLRESDRPNARAVLTLNADGTKLPFFFLHGSITGGGYYCRILARILGDDQPLVLLRPLGLDGEGVPESIEAIAESYLAQIRAERPTGPYLLGGFSAGGLAAYEIARRLRAAGEDVRRLVVLDAFGRNPRLLAFIRRFEAALHRLRVPEPTRTRLGGLLAQLPFVVQRFRRSTEKRAFLADVLRPGRTGADDVLAAWMARAETFAPKPYDGPMTLLLARENPLCAGTIVGWSALVPNLVVREVGGDHHGCIVEHVDETAHAIAAALA